MSFDPQQLLEHLASAALVGGSIAWAVLKRLPAAVSKGVAMTPAAQKMIQDLDTAADNVVAKIASDGTALAAAQEAGAEQESSEIVAAAQPIIAKLQAAVAPPAPPPSADPSAPTTPAS